MEPWRPHAFRNEAQKRCLDDETIDAALRIGNEIRRRNSNVAVIFTLRHLSHLADVDWKYLRKIASRAEQKPYRLFRIEKRTGAKGEDSRYRVICVPDPGLLRVQHWLAKNVLRYGNCHPRSFAYAPKSDVVRAAAEHCNARWLIKLDIVNFFESISEKDAYEVFLRFGYQPLLAFEMARICTRLGRRTKSRAKLQLTREPRDGLPYTEWSDMGHLPQGAPTSPMLSNLAVVKLDEDLSQVAEQGGLTYTRYADDITFSTSSKEFSRNDATTIVALCYEIIASHGFSPNTAKTKVVPPRARKIVLGLNVDGQHPRLGKSYKKQLRQHLYYLSTGARAVLEHSKRRNFVSVAGLRNHLRGRIAYACRVEPMFGQQCLRAFEKIEWPI